MASDGFKDYFKILGVSRNATDKEIKSAFRKLARKFHPDLHPHDERAEFEFKEINEAYDFIIDHNCLHSRHHRRFLLSYSSVKVRAQSEASFLSSELPKRNPCRSLVFPSWNCYSFYHLQNISHQSHT